MGTAVSKTVYAYANDPSGSPQVQSMTNYDDTNTPGKVDFSYDQYGNVTDKREYGDQISGQWKVRRRTHYTYIAYQPYIDAYLRSLTHLIEVFDALENTSDSDDVLVAKTEYEYDGTTVTTYSGANPPGFISNYNGATRGNQTSVRAWTNPGSNVSIANARYYDMFGNLVKEQVSCCNEKSFSFGQSTYWSKPAQVTSGSTGGIHLTDSFVYSFNSGTKQSRTDPSNQITTYSYDTSNSLTGTTGPTGATFSASYNAWGRESSTTRQYVENGVTKTITTSAVFDGWGQPIQEVNEHGGQVNITYDSMGRMASRTYPFQQGGTPAPATNYQYDALGRNVLITWPGGSTVAYTFSGKTATTTDQVNRKIKTEADSLGRQIKTFEQDSSGNLTQATVYTYDIADRLTQVDQGGQIRSFKYDAVGRLLFEKIPEQTATINDGTGTLWTTKYTYTDFGEVATLTDARGVITTNTYDGLNRLTGVSYNTTNAPGVAATPSVSYNYDNNQSSATKGHLLSITVGSSYTKAFNYTVGSGNGGAKIDLTSVTCTIDGKTYTVGYQDNQAGQRTQLTFPSGRKLDTAYDSKGRLLSLVNNADSSNYLSAMTYNYLGFRNGWTLGNGTVETFTFDTNREFLASHTAVNKGSTLLSLSYSYQAAAGQSGPGSTAGNAHQIISITGSIGGLTESASYTYDLQKRLVTSSQATNGTSTDRRFAYDRWGNHTTMWNATSGGTLIQAMSYHQSGGAPTNQVNQLSIIGNTVSYTHDAAGNVTSDGVNTFVYDAKNRIVSRNGGSETFAYDHNNNRIKKAVSGGATTHYIWDRSKVIA